MHCTLGSYICTLCRSRHIYKPSTRLPHAPSTFRYFRAYDSAQGMPIGYISRALLCYHYIIVVYGPLNRRRYLISISQQRSPSYKSVVIALIIIIFSYIAIIAFPRREISSVFYNGADGSYIGHTAARLKSAPYRFYGAPDQNDFSFQHFRPKIPMH